MSPRRPEQCATSTHLATRVRAATSTWYLRVLQVTPSHAHVCRNNNNNMCPLSHTTSPYLDTGHSKVSKTYCFPRVCSSRECWFTAGDMVEFWVFLFLFLQESHEQPHPSCAECRVPCDLSPRGQNLPLENLSRHLAADEAFVIEANLRLESETANSIPTENCCSFGDVSQCVKQAFCCT